MITHPAPGFAVARGETLLVEGFAWSGHVAVAAVRVSTDGGITWIDAALAPEVHRFAWRRFMAEVQPTPDQPIQIVAQATDVTGASQPLDAAPWNPRGYLNSVVHRVDGRIL